MREVVYSKETCQHVLSLVHAMEEPRWYHRLKINSRPTKGQDVSDYYFCGDAQQPKAFNQLLQSLAPEIEGYRLKESIVNRYDPGQYMPEHVDLSHYQFNIVIPLCEAGDGVWVNDQWIEDEAGVAVVFPYKSLPHSVPPVKRQRYVVIYLYE